mmetsp:Transcript_90492/g.160282  ORF Transcript_90492/g.160282 Transcript_90492/m.160282 type:complete len:231 (+) Transcript_90492:56-748(+)
MVQIQPAVMPMTPLARGMCRFGGCTPLGSDDMAEIKSAHVLDAGETETPDVTETAAQPEGDLRVPQKALCVHLHDNSSIPDALAKRYESKDFSGRVWGMPSAFGRGQCLDCPAKAMPPSMRCESCQRRLSQGKPISRDDLQQIQSSFNNLLQSFSGKKHEDITKRLDQLYLLLQTGKVAEPMEAQLLSIAKAISVNDFAAVTKQVTDMSAEHWDQHKEWLTGLKRLISKH